MMFPYHRGNDQQRVEKLVLRRLLLFCTLSLLSSHSNISRTSCFRLNCRTSESVGGGSGLGELFKTTCLYATYALSLPNQSLLLVEFRKRRR